MKEKDTVKAEHIPIIKRNERDLIERLEADMMAMDPTGGMVRRYHEVLNRPTRKFKRVQKLVFKHHG